MAQKSPKIEKLPNSRIKFTVEVDGAKIKQHYEMAVAKVGQHIEIKGFRKGKAPRNLVIERAGNGAILNEMFETIIPETYYLFLKNAENITPVEQPKVDVTELAGLDKGELIPTAMTYTAEVDVMPDVTLPDYKKIKVKPKQTDVKIEDKEIDGSVEEIKKMYGDEYLKVGQFKDEKELRAALAESIKQQKVIQAESDTYDEIIEALLKKAKIEVPLAFVHNEIHRMERQVEMQAKAYNMTFEDWLAAEKKTHDDIHKEWHPQAEKAAKVGMLLGRIAEAEGIDPSNNDASRLVLEKLYEYATK
jgi:FKBP-type peptidyl-prolyl cis-trans isomerase (trigger factor)